MSKVKRPAVVIIVLAIVGLTLLLAGGVSNAGNNPGGHCFTLGSDSLPGPEVRKCIPFDPGSTKDFIEKLIDELPPE